MNLKERLNLVSQGRAAHATYIPSLLTNFANLPVSVYLSQYPDELERLCQIVNYPKVFMSGLTYQDIALRVMVLVEQKLPIGKEALDILTKPFLEIYQRHLTMIETLVEKLKQNSNPTVLVAQLFTEDYFDAIGDMLNDAAHYERVYLSNVPVYGEGSNLIAQTLYEAAQTPHRYKVFFQILIQPFTAMKGVHYYDARYHYRK